MEFLILWEVVCRRKWTIISVFLLFFLTVVIATHVIPPTYEAKARVLIDKNDVVSAITSNLGLQGMGSNIDTDIENFQTNIALVTIRPLLEEMISSLSLTDRKGDPLKPEKVVEPGLISMILPQPSIEIEQYEESRILEIVAKSSDPAEAAKMSNLLAKLYIEDTLGKTKEVHRNVGLFLEAQVQQLKDQYYDSLADLKQFKLAQKVIDLDLESQNLLTKIENLQNNYEDAEQTILTLEQEIADIEAQLIKTTKYRKESKEFIQNEVSNQLKTKINDSLINLAGLGIEVHKEHPEFQRLEKELETAKDVIKKETDLIFNRETFSIDPMYDDLTKQLIEAYIDKEVALARKNLLGKYIETYQDELLTIPEKDDANTKLQFFTTVNKQIYQTLQEYLYQIRIAETMMISTVRVVEFGVEPDEPSFPKKLLMYIFGILLGGFWGLGTGFFKEYIDNTVKTPRDIKETASLPFLGSIPKTRFLKRSKAIARLKPTSPVVETYRRIKNTIRYAFGEKPINAIIVTSAVKNEGKSSVASNLSIAFTTQSQKVILVDLNFRKPALHKFFDISNEKGITTVIAQKARLTEVLMRTQVKGLYVVPCGPVPADPGRMIESKRLKDVLSRLKQNFDIVILDTPPMTVVNDPIVVGTSADGIVLVAEPGKITPPTFEFMKGAIEGANLSLIGVILNKVH